MMKCKLQWIGIPLEIYVTISDYWPKFLDTNLFFRFILLRNVTIGIPKFQAKCHVTVDFYFDALNSVAI